MIDLNGAPRYVHQGWFLISDANLVVIVLMIVVFALAIALPFPGAKREGVAWPPEPPTWTGRVRDAGVGALPPDKLLPDTQPVYVASWIYVFGVLTLAAFVVILVSGAVIALAGPAWWHTSSVGHFVNSTHLWSTELFFFFMVVHLWGKFFMAAWRGRRALTWITGAIAFLVSIGTAFTGYLSQQNFDSQWIGGQAKDGLNAVGHRRVLQRPQLRPDAALARRCCCRSSSGS